MSTKRRMIFAVPCLVACLTAIPIPQAKAAGVDISSASSSVMRLMEYISNIRIQNLQRQSKDYGSNGWLCGYHHEVQGYS